MPTLELSVEEIQTVLEALHHRVAAYVIQHRTVKIKGFSKADHENGAAWIDRYNESVNKIAVKLEAGMEMEILLKLDKLNDRYMWSYNNYHTPQWRSGLKTLEETKTWLMGPKLMNPHLVFTIV